MSNPNLSIDDKVTLVNQVGEEIVTKEELVTLLKTKQNPIAYDGFEPSGQIHIAQGLLRAINVNKMTTAGFTFKMWVADWFGLINNKMGGDMEKIRNVGMYFIEVWKASGMNLEKVEFIWASEFINKHSEYWETVLKIGMRKNLPRVLRTIEIMGRSDTDTLTAAQVIYPLMQATDIFMLQADVAQLGMDQRKVNMLAREVAEDIGFTKPISVSHHMLAGLLPPTDKENEQAVDRAIRLKMSKSKPDSAIFMTDSKEDIERKIKNAWAPEGDIKDNPILEYCKYIVFEKVDKMLVERPEKFGGNVEYSSYLELEKDYVEKKLFPLDLKNALAKYLNDFLEPVRRYFEENTEAKKLKELVESYEITR